MPVLIVADSWGRGLQHKFEKVAPGIVTVSTNPGCNLKRLFKRADKRIAGKNYNVLIILGGIHSHHPKVKIIVAPTMGIDLAKYNTRDVEQEEHFFK